MSVLPEAPFGRLLTAMVTPFDAAGAVDLAGAARLAQHLCALGNDGLVICGTTGEAPTLSDDEQEQLLRAVLAAVGSRAQVLAGVSANDTAHARELAQRMAAAGAHGLLATTPYYNRPPQRGVVAHIEAIAEAGAGVPVMLYDVPARTGLALDTDTIVALAGHPQVVALKDAKLDLTATGLVRLRAPALAVYCGADEVNLPLLALGAVGLVSVLAHVASPQLRRLLDAVDSGDLHTATQLHLQLLPAVRALFSVASPAPAKAALAAAGLPAGTVRLPLAPCTAAEWAAISAELAGCGIAVGDAGLPGASGGPAA